MKERQTRRTRSRRPETPELSTPSMGFIAPKNHAQASFQVTYNACTISAFNSKDLKAFLESLYLWFIHNSDDFGSRKNIQRVALHLNFEDVICISTTLFEELSKKLHVPLDSSSANQSLGGEILQPESDAVEEEIIMLLLRCCMASVNFLEKDHSVLFGRCEFLHRIFCMLCSCQNNDSSEGCKISAPIKPDVQVRLVCRILEVFMDELVKSKSLSKYIRLSAFLSPARENMCHCVELGYVLKLVSAHFVQSFSGVQGFEGSIKNLVWTCSENRETPEVSLTAAVSLLINPALSSPPAFLHAHIISLFSDVIGRVTLYDRMDSNLSFRTCHIPAFDKSVSLYCKQLPKVVHNLLSENDDLVIKSAVRGVGHERRPFEFYVCPSLGGKLKHMIKNINCSSCMVSSQTNSNMVATLKSYVMESLHLLDESCRSTASLFLSFLVENAISDESEDVHINGDVTPEDYCLLASILKLMSCSLLQTVLYMSSVRNSVHRKASSGDSFPVKDYALLARIIGSFGQNRIQLPVQKLLHSKFEAHFSTVNGTKLMFVHLTGLLSVCLAGGIEILAKGCLYMMLNLMNLLFFEDGSLNFFNQSVSPTKVTVFGTTVGMEEGHTNRRSSIELASNFKKAQMSCIRTGSENEEEDETCNGVAFLKCRLSKKSEESDACLEDELVDFVKCKRGKDYSAWLKKRARYTTWKLQKVEDQAREMKKTTWRSIRRTRFRAFSARFKFL